MTLFSDNIVLTSFLYNLDFQTLLKHLACSPIVTENENFDLFCAEQTSLASQFSFFSPKNYTPFSGKEEVVCFELNSRTVIKHIRNRIDATIPPVSAVMESIIALRNALLNNILRNKLPLLNKVSFVNKNTKMTSANWNIIRSFLDQVSTAISTNGVLSKYFASSLADKEAVSCFKRADRLFKLYRDCGRLKKRIDSYDMSFCFVVGKGNVASLIIQEKTTNTIPQSVLNSVSNSTTSASTIAKNTNSSFSLNTKILWMIDLGYLLDLPRGSIIESQRFKTQSENVIDKKFDTYRAVFFHCSDLPLSGPTIANTAILPDCIDSFFNTLCYGTIYEQSWTNEHIRENASDRDANLIHYTATSPGTSLTKTDFCKDETDEDCTHFLLHERTSLLGVIEPISSMIRMNGGKAIIPTHTAMSYIHAHLLRYEGGNRFWTMVSSVLYCSMSRIAHDLILKTAGEKIADTKGRFVRLFRSQIFAKLVLQEEMVYNSSSLFSKYYSNLIFSKVCEHMNILPIEEETDSATRMIWQEMNITNTKKYSQAAIVVAAITMLFTLFGLLVAMQVNQCQIEKNNIYSLLIIILILMAIIPIAGTIAINIWYTSKFHTMSLLSLCGFEGDKREKAYFAKIVKEKYKDYYDC